MASGGQRKSNQSSSRAGSKKKTTAPKSRPAAKTNRSSSKSKRSKTSKAAQKNRMKDEILVLAAIASALILVLSNFGLAGVVGEKIKWFMFGLFGVMEYIFPVILAGTLAFLVSNRNLIAVARVKSAAVYALTVFLAALVQRGSDKPSITQSSVGTFFTYSAEQKTGGGFFGGIVCKLLSPLGVWGSIVILLILCIICVIIITEKSFIKGLLSVKQSGSRMVHAAKQDYDIYKEHSSERLEADGLEPGARETEEEYLARRRQEKEQKRSEKAAKREKQLAQRRENEENKRIARMDKKARGVTMNTILPNETPQTADQINIHEIKVDTNRNDQFSNDIYDPLEKSSQFQTQTDLYGNAMPESMNGDIYQNESTLASENLDHMNQEQLGYHSEEDKISAYELDQNMGQDIIFEETVEPVYDPLIADVTRNLEQELKQRGIKEHTTEMDKSDSGYEEIPQDEGYEENEQYQSENPGYNLSESSSVQPEGGIDQEEHSSVQDGHISDQEEHISAPEEDSYENDLADEKQREPITPVVSENRSDKPAVQNSVDSNSQEPKKEPPKPKPYQFPPISLLKQNVDKRSGNQERENRATALRLQQTLQNFGVKVTITDISCGPAVTRYELQPEQGVKVSKIVSLSDDIKLNLAAADIRIEAPIPGKAAIGIEVPNKEAGSVMLRELLETDTFKNHPSPVSFAAGKDIAGKTIVADIAKMPHLLIAGATGSGKSVCINTIIMSILYKANPDDVKLIMVDPKVVELSVYNGIPHLMIPVVTDPKKASGALNWAVAEMTDRYKKFAQMNVRDLKGYNAKISKLDIPEGVEPPAKMPQIVIIIDELADLMMVAPGEVEDAICRLAQLARAAGIHLVIATQRPSVNVITGLIKANVPSRIAFSVSSGVDSRTIIDMNGAEKLLGKGDMLFFPSRYPKPVRVQGAFVSDEEVGRVVDFLKDNMTDQVAYNEEVTNAITSVQAINSHREAEQERDAYFAEAGRFVIGKEKGSIGMLQRYYKIGFNRAARIMDQLSDAGVVGPEVGTKPRKIEMTLEEFEEYLKKNS